MKKTILTGFMLGIMATAIAGAAITLLDSSIVTALYASEDEEPRSDRACEQVVRNEGEQNERTEPEGVFQGHDMPDAQRHPGADNAREGAETATGDCLDP